MSGEEQDTFALCVRVPGAILALELDSSQHLRVREGTEFENLEQQPSKMHEDGARDDAALRFRAGGEGLREVRDGNAPARPVEHVKQQPEARAHCPNQRAWEHAKERSHGGDREKLEAVSHAACPARASAASSRAARVSGASSSSRNGTADNVNGRGPSG